MSGRVPQEGGARDPGAGIPGGPWGTGETRPRAGLLVGSRPLLPGPATQSGSFPLSLPTPQIPRQGQEWGGRDGSVRTVAEDRPSRGVPAARSPGERESQPGSAGLVRHSPLRSSDESLSAERQLPEG